MLNEDAPTAVPSSADDDFGTTPGNTGEHRRSTPRASFEEDANDIGNKVGVGVGIGIGLGHHVHHPHRHGSFSHGAEHTHDQKHTIPMFDMLEKELEVTVECPNRVVVRLERMMGSDRAKITNGVYMEGLLEQVQIEEKDKWDKRVRRRQNREETRFRRLAIAGLMEPTVDMKDVYKHPLYRVNKIMNRLARMDVNMAMTHELPPMTPIEPMQPPYDGGQVFQHYPGHNRGVDSSALEVQEDFYEKHAPHLVNILNLRSRAMKQMKQQRKREDDEDDYSFIEKAKAQSLISKDEQRSQLLGEDDEDEVAPLHDFPSEEDEGEGASHYPLQPKVSTFDLGKLLNMNADETSRILNNYKSYRSPLVSLMFGPGLQSRKQFYDKAKEVVNVYNRENRFAKEFCSKLGKLLIRAAQSTVRMN